MHETIIRLGHTCLFIGAQCALVYMKVYICLGSCKKKLRSTYFKASFVSSILKIGMFRIEWILVVHKAGLVRFQVPPAVASILVVHKAWWPDFILDQAYPNSHFESIRKSLFFLPQLSQKFTFPPSTSKPDKSPPSTFQTVHFTSLERF
jgi:hypothetical protein